jgi:hypothetical protein
MHFLSIFTIFQKTLHIPSSIDENLSDLSGIPDFFEKNKINKLTLSRFYKVVNHVIGHNMSPSALKIHLKVVLSL